MRVRITKRADAHIDQAAAWWKKNRPIAPHALDEELKAAFSLRSAQPAIGAPALNVKAKAVRRVHLARIHIRNRALTPIFRHG